MTEQDYIITTALARCRIALQVLREIGPPEIVPSISTHDYQRVYQTVAYWEDCLSKRLRNRLDEVRDPVAELESLGDAMDDPPPEGGGSVRG